MSSRRTRLIHWIEQGAIAPARVWPALAVAGVTPDRARWLGFLQRLMLVLGTLALALAVLFFVAFHWQGMGRFSRLGLLQLPLLAAVFGYWKLGTERFPARLALFAAALLLGALLAQLGQAYQTGADNWQLFASWALLMLPWTVVGRFAPLWLLFLLLTNLAVTLYFQVFPGLLWIGFGAGDQVLWLLLLFNTAAWALWEMGAARLDWLSPRWAVRLVAIASGSAMTLLVLQAIFRPATLPLISWLVYACWLLAVYHVYRHRLPDLFMLAGACLSVIVCCTALLGHQLLSGSVTSGPFLLLAMLVVVQGAAAAAWLRHVQAQQPS
jgi:uncharacterized membrane protein